MKIDAASKAFKPIPSALSTADDGPGAGGEKPVYLREWRKACGLTLVQVAQRIGAHFTSVGKWEQDVRGVDAHTLGRLAQVYGVPTSALHYRPENAGDAELFSRFFRVLHHMPRDKVGPWLAFAESYVDNPAEPKGFAPG